jgi:hypothetical protein
VHPERGAWRKHRPKLRQQTPGVPHGARTVRPTDQELHRLRGVCVWGGERGCESAGCNSTRALDSGLERARMGRERRNSGNCTPDPGAPLGSREARRVQGLLNPHGPHKLHVSVWHLQPSISRPAPRLHPHHCRRHKPLLPRAPAPASVPDLPLSAPTSDPFVMCPALALAPAPVSQSPLNNQWTHTLTGTNGGSGPAQIWGSTSTGCTPGGGGWVGVGCGRAVGAPRVHAWKE